MGFLVAFKYSLITIIRSKQFIITSIVISSIIILLNLSWNSYIVVTQNEAKALWSINAINTVLIFVWTSIVSIIFAYEFIYLQKKNGVKLLELKSGLKPWQMFFSKITAITIVNLTIVLLFVTIIILMNLIFFNSNLTVVKLISINLYSLVLIAFLMLSYAFLANVFNWNKIALILLGLITGIFSLYPLFNAVAYDFTSTYVEDLSGKNTVDHSNEDINLSYQSKRVASLVGESKLVEELKTFRDDCILENSILKIDDPQKKLESEKMAPLKQYYETFIDPIRKGKERIFLKSGQLWDIVDTFNKANKEILKDEYFFEIKFVNGECSNKDVGDFLREVDIPKGKLNIFSPKYNGAKTIGLIKEMKNYINNLEVELKKHKEYSIYYDDWKEINKIVLDYYNKYFYFASLKSTWFDPVSPDLSWISKNWEKQEEENEENKKYFAKDEYRVGGNQGWEDFLYNIRSYSSGRIMYQRIFFKIITPLKPEASLADSIDRRFVKNHHLFHYYTSPFLWLEYLSMYGFNSHSYENLASIQTHYFFGTNNFIEIKFEAPQKEDKTFETTEFKYKGPNRWIILFMVFITSVIFIGIAFWVYKYNLYR